ncbi:type I secretion system permease/ATPase [Alphaproteobacteria bacterium GH1-50]|uniref:Type I secretion system permease/ATPase n=1 Tax=Kangsaoukella pontilimi TaxID=2691042 RepID=A0A7C9MYG7_9RHOB|nr:type I secretion system permease/ATPase [Kangsaoukella pontilimi]
MSEELRQARARSMHFIWFSFFFSIFVNLLMLTGPLFMLQVYDRVLGSRSEETLVALTILVVALYGLMWLLDFARSRLVARYGARFQSDLDERVFKAVIEARGRRTPSRGALTASRDLEAIQGFFASPGLIAMLDTPFTPIFVAAIFVFHPALGWLALGGGVALITLTLVNQALTNRKTREAQQVTEDAHRFAESAAQSAELLRAQGMVDAVSDRWLARRDEALGKTMNAVDWTGSFTTFTKAFRLTLQSLILALGAWLVLGGELTAGAMIAASILLGRALAPIEQVLGRWPQIQRARQGWASLSDFLAAVPQPEEKTRLPRPEGRLDVKGVTVTSGPGTPAILYNISFTLAPGEALGVIGRSGSGKTTIARLLLGLIDPPVGEVRLGGALLSQYDPADLGQHVGYLPQEAQMVTGTLAENIARMSTSPDSAAVVAAAQKARAHDLILSLPDGYDTMVREGMLALSGGQRQRIALARALYGDPVLLVLDEPNSALDLEGTEALNAAVRDMKSDGRSVVIMTHRPMAISECDRLMVIDGGRVKALGPRDEVLKSMMKNAGDIQRTIGRGDST